jgi:valyl-tRNA synthetase
MYDDALVEQGRNFANKVWNAFRLVQTWQVDETLADDPAYRETTGRNNAIATEWFGHTLNRAIEEIESDFDQYRISEALMRTYKLFWDEFSGWYLELVKPAYQQPIDAPTYQATLGFFEKLLQLLHPFTPFFTEEIWHRIGTRADGESIMLTTMPQSTGYDSRLLVEFDGVKETITAIRNIRRQKNIPNREALTLYVKPDENYRERYNPVVMKMANLSSIEETTHKIDNASAFIIKSTEYFVPLGDNINIEEELTKLKAALEYQQGFLRTVMGKLNNERFVAGAPAQVVAGEQAKKADAEAKIAALQQQIAQLG